MIKSKEATVSFAPVELSYSYDALEPILSEQAMRLHYDKHYRGYLTNLERLSGDTIYGEMTLPEIIKMADGPIFNNAAQVWNHQFFFEQFNGMLSAAPSFSLMGAIVESFDSMEKMQRSINEAAMALFGSGWVWLCCDPNSDDRLKIETTQNGDTPIAHNLRPILTIDLWEHAYYVDYQNRRADYLANIWNIMNWGKISERY